jgi:hypothetical protein
LLIGVGAGAIWDSASSVNSAASLGREFRWWRVPRIDPLAARWGVALALGAPLLIYPLAAIAGGAVAARVAPARTLPGRDPIAFYLWPPKTGYMGARGYGEAALASVAPRAAIVADWLPYETLRYLQTIERRRPDVDVQNINAGGGAQLSFLLAQDGQRPLYLADNTPFPYYDMPEIERCFAVQRESVVYRLVRRGDACA